jgi:hypothetical protein
MEGLAKTHFSPRPELFTKRYQNGTKMGSQITQNQWKNESESDLHLGLTFWLKNDPKWLQNGTSFFSLFLLFCDFGEIWGLVAPLDGQSIQKSMNVLWNSLKNRYFHNISWIFYEILVATHIFSTEISKRVLDIIGFNSVCFYSFTFE